MLGAPTVIALADRGAEQLAVLHPHIAVCTGGGDTTAVADLVPAPTPAKPPHVICEFTSGTEWSGGSVSRSTRIILRFAALPGVGTQWVLLGRVALAGGRSPRPATVTHDGC